MKTTTYKSLGLNVVLTVPASVDEFDKNAKRDGACLEEGINNVVYRGSLAEFRSLLCEQLETETGEPRKTRKTGRTRTEKDADGKETVVEVETWGETEAEYVGRIAALKGWGDDKSVLQSMADKLAPTIVFDASATERKTPEPKKLQTAILDSAKALWDKTLAKYADAATAWSKIRDFIAGQSGHKLVDQTGDTTKDIESIGWAIKANEDFKRKQVLSEGYKV